MHYGIKSNMREVERGLSDAARKQVPYATSLAINEVLGDIKRNSEKRLRRVLDRPTPFTMKAFGIRYASKRTLSGMVFIKDIQAQYLRFAEDGGVRTPHRRTILVPVKQRVNKYGNMPRGAVGRTIAKANTFIADGRDNRTKHLTPGIYQRPRAGLQRRGGHGRLGSDKVSLLVTFEDKATYRPRLNFKVGAARTAAARLPDAFRRALLKAMASIK